ncbi:MAG: hypothetical protein EOP06_29270, partial [Proteobacteria bacterium]
MCRMSFITAIAQHSAAGSGMDSLLEAVESGQRPALATETLITKKGPVKRAYYSAPEVDVPAGVSANVARRMSRLSKMFLHVAGQLFQQSSSEQNGAQASLRTGLIIGTAFSTMELSRGFQDSVHRSGSVGASPTLFAGSVQNAIAAQVSLTYAIQGPCCTVMTMEQTVVDAFSMANAWIAEDRVDQVYVLLGDEYCQYNLYALMHLPEPPLLEPEKDDCTAIMGEGVAGFIISREASENALCRIKSIEVFAESPPKSPRVFAASYGGFQQ